MKQLFMKSFTRPVRALMQRGFQVVPAICMLSGFTALAGPGDLLVGFPSNEGPDNIIYQVVVQPDDNVLVGGDFLNWGAKKQGRIARVLADGTLDGSFNLGDGFNAGVYALALQADGKILAGGDFGAVSGVARLRLARLKADGEVDDTLPSLDFNSSVYAILAIPGGDFLVGGPFTSVLGQPRTYLARIKANGTLDPTLNTTPNGTVYALARQTDGKLLVGGEFSAVGSTPRIRIARYNTDGTLDTTFDPGAGPNSTVYCLAPALDGGVFVGGQFNEFNGLPRVGLARLMPSGLPDAGFNAQVNATVFSVAAQADGRVVFAGDFGIVSGVERIRIARVRSDGQLDPAFVTPAGADNRIRAVALEADGNVLLGGQFAKVAGVNRRMLARVQGLATTAGGELEFSAARYTVSESLPSVTLEVRRNGNTGSAVSVGFSTANITANAGDYTPQVGGTLNFAPGETKKPITISLRSDTLVEDTETFSVTLENPTGGAALGATAAAVVSIEDNDLATQPGSFDGSFAGRVAAGAGFYSDVTLIQPDGRIIVAGNFNEADGSSRLRIARFRPDGSLDSSFLASAWLNAPVYCGALQTDGKILLGGSFTLASGVTRNRIARFNADGTLDRSFDAGAGPNSDVYTILPRPNGDILVGGPFSAFTGQPSSAYLVRLFSDGSVDSTFTAVPNSTVHCLAADKDGRILLGGDFTFLNGTPRFRIARVSTDGALDDTFDSGAGANTTVRSLVPLADGTVIAAGNFSVFNGFPQVGVARLAPDGTLDPSFTSSVNGVVNRVVVQSDGRVILGGSFTEVAGQSRSRLARLRANGTLDPSFDVGTGANDQIYALALQSDQNLIIGGAFTTYGAFAHPGLARIVAADIAPGGVIDFVASAFSVSEAAPSVTIQVRRSGDTTKPVTVNYAGANGTANAGDYTAPSGKLTFGVGETAKSFTVAIRPDALPEDDETVLLSLSAPTGGAALGSQANAVLTILNEDTPTEAGALDGLFTSGLNDEAFSSVVLSDDTILVTGNFSRVGSANRLRIARLLADGPVDPSFNPAAWTDGVIYTAVIQEDGRILIGGEFSTVNGQRRPRIARLYADGTLDPTFNAGEGPNSTVFTIWVSPLGDIVVGGAFYAVSGDPQRAYLIRLFNDGSVDQSFEPRVNSTVYKVVPVANQKLMICGDFTRVGDLNRIRVARLSGEGQVDPDFDSGAGPNTTVRTLLPLANGSMLIGGNFTVVNGLARSYICRLLADGIPDPSFPGQFNNFVSSIVAQFDGKFIVSGAFTANGVDTANRLVRLLPDGTPDVSFDMSKGANDIIWSTALQLDGSIIALGRFTQFNGFNKERIVRIQAQPAVLGGEIEFSATRYSVAEGAGSATIEVRRLGNTSSAVTVDYTVANGTATAADYSGASGKLVFGAGESKKTFSVAIKQDELIEDDETILLSLANPSGSSVLGGIRRATLIIVNDDRRPTDFGTVDTSGVVGANGPVYDILVQPDGKWLVGGEFSAIGSVARLRLARLNANGSVDSSFEPATWFNGTVLALGLQSDGRVLVAGQFTQVNGVNRNRIARLTSDGLLDNFFDPGVGPNTDIYSLFVLPDDDIVVGGPFSAFNSDANYSYLARLLSDGTLATTFTPRVNSTVWTIAPVGTDRLVIGGDFTSVGGQLRTRLASIQLDGGLVAGFDPGTGPNSTVRALRALPDKRVLIGGSFSSYAGKSAQYLARIGTDGAFDASFAGSASLNSTVWSLAIQPDGRIVATGDFTTFGGASQGYVARLSGEGLLDPTLAIGTGANGGIRRGVLHPDGHLLLGGTFSTFNGLNRPYLVQIFANPPSNAVGPFIQSIALESANQVLLTIAGTPGQKYKLQSSPTIAPTLWTEISTGTLSAPTAVVPQTIPAQTKTIFFRVLSQ